MTEAATVARSTSKRRTTYVASGFHRAVPFIGGRFGGLWERRPTRRARGHVELLQLKAHEREAPREGLGGTNGALSWDRGERARAPRTLQRASGGIGRYCVRPYRQRPLEMGME